MMINMRTWKKVVESCWLLSRVGTLRIQNDAEWCIRGAEDEEV
jgi:hypothetical protein